jgi:drug/metabolite transporter (DMT)-like permease
LSKSQAPISKRSTLDGRFSVDLLLLTVALFWGASYYFAKTLTAHASVPGMLAVRFGAATLMMVGIWFFRRDRFTRADLLGGASTGIMLFVIMMIETTSISLTSATNAGLIISLTIVLTPVFESLWTRRWLPPTFFVAVVGAIVGVGLLVGEHGFSAPNLGDFIMLGAALVRSLNTVAQGHVLKFERANTFNVTIVQIATASVLFFISDVPGSFAAAAGFDANQWFSVLFLAAFCTVFGFIALLWGIRKTSPSRASLLLSTEPIWAVAVASLVGGELLGPLGLAGGALIIGFSFWALAIEARRRVAQ